MKWLLLIAILLFAVCLMPIGIVADYSNVGFRAALKIGPILYRFYPKKKSRTKGKKGKDVKEIAITAQEEKSGGKLTDFLPLVRTILNFLGDLKGRMRVNQLQLKIILAEDDPCDLSVHYGKTWAAVGGLQMHLDKLFRIKNQKIEVECDYLADATTVLGSVDVSLGFLQLLTLVIRYGLQGFKQFNDIKNDR